MKKLIRWMYTRFVNDLFVPEYQTFSIATDHEGHWNSFLPNTFVLHVKKKDGVWQDVCLKR